MGYLNIKQLSEKWGISERRIIKLCSEGRIDGAIKNGGAWQIPESTIKPVDKRAKISQYINTEKRILIVNIEEPVCEYIIPLLQGEGYIVDGIYQSEIFSKSKLFKNINLFKLTEDIEKTIEETNKYYSGIIFVNIETKKINQNKKSIILNSLANKMNSEGAIVIVDRATEKNNNLEQQLSSEIVNRIGLRINCLKVKMPNSNKYIIDYKSIANDIIAILTKFRNTTNNIIKTNGAIVEFNQDGKTSLLTNGEYYKLLNYYYNNLNSKDYLWLISPMMEDEWTESPLEMNFRVINLEAVNKGVKIERIFIFKKEKIKKYKENTTLNIFMKSNMTTLYVDYDEIMKKEPHLIEMIGSGIGGINKHTFFYDLPCEGKYRAYISINKQEIQENYKCFLKIKKYAVDLATILKK